MRITLYSGFAGFLLGSSLLPVPVPVPLPLPLLPSPPSLLVRALSSTACDWGIHREGSAAIAAGTYKDDYHERGFHGFASLRLQRSRGHFTVLPMTIFDQNLRPPLE